MEFKQAVKRWFIMGFIALMLFWVLGHLLHFLFKPSYEKKESYWKGVNPDKPITDAIFDYNTGEITYREYGPTKEDLIVYPDLSDEVSKEKHEIMNFNDIDEIKRAGFVGFKKMSDLFSDCTSIPKVRGVYLVLNPNPAYKAFLEVGTGGFFKGRNPNVSVEVLNSNWVENSLVLYIGKAGSETSQATLYSRLKQYINFGQGRNVGHWGGRYIWQLENSADLIVCWKPLPKDDPREVEGQLIRQFTSTFYKRPFANLVN